MAFTLDEEVKFPHRNSKDDSQVSKCLMLPYNGNMSLCGDGDMGLFLLLNLCLKVFCGYFEKVPHIGREKMKLAF